MRLTCQQRQHLGVSENVVYPIVPNGFADHYPYNKWLAIIGNINPTFSHKTHIYIYIYIIMAIYSEFSH